MKSSTFQGCKMEFHLPHMHILGTHHCDKELCEAFQYWGNIHDVYSIVIMQSR